MYPLPIFSRANGRSWAAPEDQRARWASNNIKDIRLAEVITQQVGREPSNTGRHFSSFSLYYHEKKLNIHGQTDINSHERAQADT